MRLLKRLFAADDRNSIPQTETALEREERERLEKHLRQGARTLSSRTPARLHGRIMERIERDLDSRTPLPSAPARPLRRPFIGLTAALAAAVLGFVLLRGDSATPPSSSDLSPGASPVAGLRAGMLELLQPVLEAPIEVDQTLEQEAQNLLEDSQRLLVIVLPTKLSKPLEKF